MLGLTAGASRVDFRESPEIRRAVEDAVRSGADTSPSARVTTRSGGEAQVQTRERAHCRQPHERTLYVLDEPTTGLHVADVERLVHVLGRLVERGDTLVVIEHHPHVMAGADWLIELGPEGGDAGGRVVAKGPPRDVASKATATGRVLSELFAEISASSPSPSP